MERKPGPLFTGNDLEQPRTRSYGAVSGSFWVSPASARPISAARPNRLGELVAIRTGRPVAQQLDRSAFPWIPAALIVAVAGGATYCAAVLPKLYAGPAVGVLVLAAAALAWRACRTGRAPEGPTVPDESAPDLRFAPARFGSADAVARVGGGSRARRGRHPRGRPVRGSGIGPAGAVRERGVLPAHRVRAGEVVRAVAAHPPAARLRTRRHCSSCARRWTRAGRCARGARLPQGRHPCTGWI